MKACRWEWSKWVLYRESRAGGEGGKKRGESIALIRPAQPGHYKRKGGAKRSGNPGPTRVIDIDVVADGGSPERKKKKEKKRESGSLRTPTSL